MLFHRRPCQRAGCAGRQACDPGTLPAILLSELESAGEVSGAELERSSGVVRAAVRDRPRACRAGAQGR